MLYKGFLKTIPVKEIIPGKIVVLGSRLAKVLEGPGDMLFFWDGKIHTPEEIGQDKLKEIVVEYEFDPTDLHPFEKGYSYDPTTDKYTKVLPVFGLQWQEIIARNLLDNGTVVDFISYGIGSTQLPLSPEAYVVFNSGGIFAEQDVRRIAWFCFDYGFKMGQAARAGDNFGPRIFNVPFEITLTGLLDRHRNENDKK
jgi:hypothetical protein